MPINTCEPDLFLMWKFWQCFINFSYSVLPVDEQAELDAHSQQTELEDEEDDGLGLDEDEVVLFVIRVYFSLLMRLLYVK